MSAMLRFRLQDKLPKPVHPEEYKKYITVLEASKDNWSLQCNFCNLRFKGRAHRANCHIIGKVGEGVVVCNKIPSHVKFQFVQSVFPELVDEEVALKTDEPNPKRTKQSSVSDFVSKAAFEHTDAEIAKFVLTSGVSFNAIRNPHLQNAFRVSMQITVPSDYKVKGPLFDQENQDINEWKQEQLSSGLLCLTGDGWTNRRRVGCMNMECITQHSGPIHYETYERTVQTKQVNQENSYN